ncbi:hypothetical protein [Sorangium sp. So ce1182]|uniref:hypothetical protein n=1 Tax=Sorangium sp. So ce1182 TaxID=3133334 RepID=UPI003F63B422
MVKYIDGARDSEGLASREAAECVRTYLRGYSCSRVELIASYFRPLLSGSDILIAPDVDLTAATEWAEVFVEPEPEAFVSRRTYNNDVCWHLYEGPIRRIAIVCVGRSGRYYTPFGL